MQISTNRHCVSTRWSSACIGDDDGGVTSTLATSLAPRFSTSHVRTLSLLSGRLQQHTGRCIDLPVEGRASHLTTPVQKTKDATVRRRNGKGRTIRKVVGLKQPFELSELTRRKRQTVSICLSLPGQWNWSGQGPALSMPQLEADGWKLAQLARSVNEGTTASELSLCQIYAEAWLRDLQDVREVFFH